MPQATGFGDMLCDDKDSKHDAPLVVMSARGGKDVAQLWSACGQHVAIRERA